jgi:hypothetical protein
MDFHQQPNSVLFGRYFKPLLLERVTALMQPTVTGLPDRLEQIRIEVLRTYLCRGSEFAEKFGIALHLLLDELGVENDSDLILTMSGRRAIFFFQGLTADEIATVGKIKAFMANLSTQERIDVLSYKLALTMAISEQMAYEEPNPITGVSRADLDCCVFIFPDDEDEIWED